jgi:hypothetical protein
MENKSPEFICFANTLVQKWTELSVCRSCGFLKFVIRSSDKAYYNPVFWKCDLCCLKDNVENHAKKIQTKKAKLRLVQAEQDGLE